MLYFPHDSGGIIMIIGFGAIALLGFAFWILWSKLHDIEQKQFRMHDEMSLSLQQIEKDLSNLKDLAYRIENKDNKF